MVLNTRGAREIGKPGGGSPQQGSDSFDQGKNEEGVNSGSEEKCVRQKSDEKGISSML